MTTDSFITWLAGLAGILLLAGFALPNIRLLRTLTTLGVLCFIPYLLLRSPILWPAIILFAAMAAANIYHLARITSTGAKFQLSGEEMMLFSRLPGLTPAQYKALLDISEWHNPAVPMQLTQTSQMPKALYYVLEGQVEVNRDKQRFSIGPHAFIGELAFLRQKPATATTFAKTGSLIVSWEQRALRNLLSSDDGVRKAVDSLLSTDLAEKIARTAPPALQEQQA